jgi:hypothetical protein
MVARACHPSYSRKHKTGAPWSKSKNQDPISKIKTEKRGGGVAQVVKRLPCKHEVLNSTPELSKQKRKNLV